jgi:hypothetical protein
MSVKTISLKREAYERLRSAKRSASESFSEVVMRAAWPEDTITARQLAALSRTGRPLFSDADLDRVAAAKRLDVPPEDKWAGR